MEGYLKKGLHRRAAQIHRRVLQRRIHLLQLWHHIENHIGQIKGHMGDEQRPEGQALLLSQQLAAHKYKQQRKRHTGDNIRVRHGNVGQVHDHLTQPGLHAVNSHSGKGAEGRGNSAGQYGNQNGIAQQLQKVAVPEQFPIPLEGKALKPGDVLAGIKGSHNQHRHGDIQEDENQDGNDPVCLFHTTTLPSSSPPKRFMMPVHTNTRIISTRLSAAPRLGLLPCLNIRSITSPISTVSVLPSF